MNRHRQIKAVFLVGIALVGAALACNAGTTGRETVPTPTVTPTGGEVTDELDHYYLNDIPPFDRVNPTAENIASYIYQAVSELINNDRVKVKAVTLWETERACVKYEQLSD